MEEIKEDLSLKHRKKLPEKTKLKRNKIIFTNLIISIGITLYFIFINLGYYNIEKHIYAVDLKVFSFIILIVAIVLFEKGYRQDDEWLFLHGIEAMMLSFTTLLMQYRLFSESEIINGLLSLAFLFFVIYYIIKALIQARKVEKEYSSSDVREIVKKGDKKND